MFKMLYGIALVLALAVVGFQSPGIDAPQQAVSFSAYADGAPVCECPVKPIVLNEKEITKKNFAKKKSHHHKSHVPHHHKSHVPHHSHHHHPHPKKTHAASSLLLTGPPGCC